ncbi:hypothetical protein [Anaplasma phagocytophilum]|uniref:hypothetical protein n=1 Tax=Anaplasma phagocytophilum TaxID=948 RepID=UPI00200D6C82|nr:hypothetical protein [Anaplasma phagocytophilum]UQD54628.1 hypothetical protein ESP60_04985 [Anaplasma phagocytophilum]
MHAKTSKEEKAVGQTEATATEQKEMIPTMKTASVKNAPLVNGSILEQGVGASVSNSNARRKAYIVIPSIVLVLSILCVSAAIYLYLQHAIALEPKALYYIIAGGVLALGFGVLSTWKLIAECKKGKGSAVFQDFSASLDSKTNAEVEDKGEQARDEKITKLTGDLRALSSTVKSTNESLETALSQLATLSEDQGALKEEVKKEIPELHHEVEAITSRVEQMTGKFEELEVKLETYDAQVKGKNPATPPSEVDDLEVKRAIAKEEKQSTKVA